MIDDFRLLLLYFVSILKILKSSLQQAAGNALAAAGSKMVSFNEQLKFHILNFYFRLPVVWRMEPQAERISLGKIYLWRILKSYEDFENWPILSKIKEDEDFNRPSTICRTYGAGSHTLSISRIEI